MTVKASTAGFILGISFGIIMLLIIPTITGDPLSLLFRSENIPVLLNMVLGCGIAIGTVFGIVGWAKKKSTSKDEVNELMRQYLEKQLREEAEKEKNQ